MYSSALKKTSSKTLTKPSAKNSSSFQNYSSFQGTFSPYEKNKSGLPIQLKSSFENFSGVSLDNVKVNYNSDKPAKIGALAYTKGSEVNIAPGQSSHLPHELGHVVQQKRRSVPTTGEIQGEKVNTNHSLEKEADSIASKALSGINGTTSNDLSSESSSDIIQGKFDFGGLMGSIKSGIGSLIESNGGIGGTASKLMSLAGSGLSAIKSKRDADSADKQASKDKAEKMAEENEDFADDAEIAAEDMQNAKGISGRKAVIKKVRTLLNKANSNVSKIRDAVEKDKQDKDLPKYLARAEKAASKIEAIMQKLEDTAAAPEPEKDEKPAAPETKDDEPSDAPAGKSA